MTQPTLQRILHRFRRAAGLTEAAPARVDSILDAYVTGAPHPQLALDIFRGEWSSKLPEPLADAQAGTLLLFDDARLRWGIEQLGGVAGKRILELGPLEGGHTYMLAQMGASSVVAVEANTRAYLKCLVVKELLGLQAAKFLCGDFVAYLRETGPRFDVLVASGVLYHMQNPMELIELMARATDRLYLWTHYYDEAVIQANPLVAENFAQGMAAEHGGFRHQLFRKHYAGALQRADFCGAGSHSTHWMLRDDLLGALRHFGFDQLRIEFDQPGHFHGPSLAVAAWRS